MKKALVVGVDYYQYGNSLYGCVTDAKKVENLLKYNIKEENQEERKRKKEKNFECTLKTSSSSKEILTRNDLKDAIENLFTDSLPDDVLFYFSGHGNIETLGGYILASDSQRGDAGISMSDILNYANESPAKNKVIILDCCYSGDLGSSKGNKPLATLSEGLTILTSSTKDQISVQNEGRGIFTYLLVDGLEGAAADIVGNITPGSLYAHIDQSLGMWEQRPVFKTNVMNFISLRNVPPKMSLEELRMIKDEEFFPTADYIFPLDPTYEPEMKGRDKNMALPLKENTEKFSILQKYNRLNLLVPVDAPHMWYAAMQSKSCKLTALGKHYWRLAKKERF